MRLRLIISVGLAALPALAAGFYTVDPGWTRILHCSGLLAAPESEARVIVAQPGTPVESALERLRQGAVLAVEGDSPLARALGIQPEERRVTVRRLRDTHLPDLDIRWKEPVRLPRFRLPAAARVFCRERKSGAPLLAGWRSGPGAVLWAAASPGPEGYERFPFLPHALADLGIRPAFESRSLWAFYDVGFRREESDQLAARWRQAGISVLHVGAWHYLDRNPVLEGRLEKLIAACHRNNILVYAWLELPHVSDGFWDEHPEWREKTAQFKDAHVDWRYLMNLANPNCRDAVLQNVRQLLGRFDWDGVNLAELYFDGIEGTANLREFTPLNDDVRREVRAAHGFDPAELFRGPVRDPAKLRIFLDYRAALAARLQERWIGELEKTGLAVVLTHVDDRFDTRMRDAIGADAARVLSMLDRHTLTFIIEDPATVWHLGPRRYQEIARRYRPLTPHQELVGVDINIVERSGKVFPTAKQTGAELIELIHTAAESFAQVAYYFEAAIEDADYPFMAPAAAEVSRCRQSGEELEIESARGVGVAWKGEARLDGQPWPVRDGKLVWVPAGRHTLSPGTQPLPLAILDFNGRLESASVLPQGLEISYRSDSRALARLDRRPSTVEIDGQPASPEMSGQFVLFLPRGAHRVRLTR